jgi:hypothetical protein
MSGGDVVFIAFFGSLLGFGLLGAVLSYLYYRRCRLLTHAERMKALEMGRELPDDSTVAQLRAVMGTTARRDNANPELITSGALAKRCFSVALWVPLGAIVATQAFSRFHGGAEATLWTAVALITSASLICGTVLATRSTSDSKNGTTELPIGNHRAKTADHDPDAYDVAGRRG